MTCVDAQSKVPQSLLLNFTSIKIRIHITIESILSLKYAYTHTKTHKYFSFFFFCLLRLSSGVSLWAVFGIIGSLLITAN